jgi:FkbM family methyltransferase
LLNKQRLAYPNGFFLKDSVAQQGEDVVLERIFDQVICDKISNGIDRTYVDIGAYHPIEHSVTYTLYKKNWNGIVFDPSESSRDAFKKFRPKDKFICAAVGAEDNIDVTFYFNSSSNSKLNKGIDLHTSNTKYVKEDLKKDYISKKVKQVNLMQELKRNNINKIDFINIDAEGAEMEILKKFDFDSYRPKVVAVEIHGNNILSAINSEIAKILFKNNYRMVASTVITYFFALEEKIKKS